MVPATLVAANVMAIELPTPSVQPVGSPHFVRMPGAGAATQPPEPQSWAFAHAVPHALQFARLFVIVVSHPPRFGALITQSPKPAAQVYVHAVPLQPVVPG